MATPTTPTHRAATTTRTTAESWMRARVAASYLGVGITELQQLKVAGLPYHQVENHNGLCLFLASEIDQWRRNRERVPRTPPVRSVRRSRYQVRRTARRTTTATTTATSAVDTLGARLESASAQPGELLTR